MRGSIAGASGWAQLEIRTHIREVSLGATRKRGDLLGLRGKHARCTERGISRAGRGLLEAGQAPFAAVLQCGHPDTHLCAAGGKFWMTQKETEKPNCHF